jgi:multidrug resistance efflux pump
MFPPADVSQPWLSASAARDTVAALEAEAGPERPWMTGLFLGLLLAGVVALVTIRVDVTARAWGIVRARTENVELRSPATASVDSVFVRSGDRVTTGQPLMRLANPALRVRREALATELDLQRQHARDWSALSMQLVQGAGALESKGLDVVTSWARRQWDEWVANDDTLHRAATRSRREWERIEAMAVRGLVSDRERDDARDTAAADEQARALSIARQAASATAQLREVEKRVQALSGELRQVDEELQSLVLRAPLDGIVMDLASLRPGAVVVASQPLGSISTEDGFRIESRVPARICALVQPGQSCRVSVTALPATEWGLMEAEVENVAPDVSAGSSEPSYRIVLKPRQVELRTRDGRRAALRKGFVAEVRFALGRATLLTLLRRNLADWFAGDSAQSVFPPATRNAISHFLQVRSTSRGLG